MTQPHLSNPEITTETLKALTGAPDLDAPLVDTEDFDSQPEPSARPLWKMPLPKLALIGTALVPIFLLASYFVLGGQKTNQPQQASSSPETDTKQTGTDRSGEVNHLKQENAELKVDSALEGQSHLLAQENSSQVDGDLTIEEIEEPNPEPAASPARTTTVNHRSAPQPMRTASPPPVPRSVAQPIRPRQVPQTPQMSAVEQWQHLALLGSYGNIAPPETSPQETPNATVQEASSTIATEASMFLASAAPMPAVLIPTAQVAPTSSLKSSTPVQRAELKPSSASESSQPINELEPPLPTVITSLLELNESSLGVEAESTERDDAEAIAESALQAIAPPSILHEAESTILTGQPRMQSLVAGSYEAGELVTPVILESGDEGNTRSEQGSQRFLVTLHEPLLNNQGTVAIPANSELLVEVEQMTETGMIQLSAVGVTWNEGTGQRELVLPPSVIAIRGQNGEPLMAEQFDDPGNEIAAMDVGQFALGAVRRTAELYTRSDARVETRNNTTIVTEDNPEPNILAGVLEGGTDAILDSIAERNRRAIAAMETRPPIWILEAGTPVQVFVNQSMQLPQ